MKKINLDRETRRVAEFTIQLLDGKIKLILRKNMYLRIILYLKNNPDDIIGMGIEDLGNKFKMLSGNRKGVYTGRDFINQLNMKWI